jgi:hypothetical protein
MPKAAPQPRATGGPLAAPRAAPLAASRATPLVTPCAAALEAYANAAAVPRAAL